MSSVFHSNKPWYNSTGRGMDCMVKRRYKKSVLIDRSDGLRELISLPKFRREWRVKK